MLSCGKGKPSFNISNIKLLVMVVDNGKQRIK